MKIALIAPNAGQVREGFELKAELAEPLGLCYIGAIAKQEGHNVKIFHQLPEDSNKNLLKEITKFSPNIVGFSTFTYNYLNALYLTKEIKKQLPDVVIVFGGVHSSTNPEIVEERTIDFVVVGEGELTFIELLKNLEENNPKSKSIKGIAYYDKGVKLTPPRERIKNLDILPIPLREGLPIAKYKRFSLSYPPPSKQKMASISFARGCIFNCSCCTSPKFWYKKWFTRSAKNAVDEIELLIKKYKINFLDIVDEDFMLNSKKVYEFCNELKNRGIDINWRCEGRVRDVDLGLLKLMKEAGCFEIGYGIESGSQKILKRISKGITLTQILRATDLTHEAGIMVAIFLIIGTPWETYHTLKETKTLIEKIKYDRVRFSFATPFKGTRLYRQVISMNCLLTRDPDKYTTEEPVIKTTLEKNYLIKFRNMLYKEFYSSRAYLSRVQEKIRREPKLYASYVEWDKFLRDNDKIRTKLI